MTDDDIKAARAVIQSDRDNEGTDGIDSFEFAESARIGRPAALDALAQARAAAEATFAKLQAVVAEREQARAELAAEREAHEATRNDPVWAKLAEIAQRVVEFGDSLVPKSDRDAWKARAEAAEDKLAAADLAVVTNERNALRAAVRDADDRADHLAERLAAAEKDRDFWKRRKQEIEAATCDCNPAHGDGPALCPLHGTDGPIVKLAAAEKRIEALCKVAALADKAAAMLRDADEAESRAARMYAGGVCPHGALDLAVEIDAAREEAGL